jgi:glycosyltransferase involved in cell wall biosynthesis
VLHASRSESLGLVAVEAQALGIPLVCSDAVPEDAIFNDYGVVRLSLEAANAAWCDGLRSVWNRRSANRQATWDLFRASPFSAERISQRYLELIRP